MSSTCAVMLVKDEADIVASTMRHLLDQVDHVIVSDNVSEDGTYGILQNVAANHPGRVTLVRDGEPGYYQSAKTTALAMQALELGYRWVVPCDADELWFGTDGRRLADYLDGMAPDVQMVIAEMFNHIPTSRDPSEPDPVVRIGWHQRQRGAMFKVACRLRPDLVIEPGNHSAYTSGTALSVPGLQIRHYSWRTAAQYINKIANGWRAYQLAPDLDPGYGGHWKMHGNPDDPGFTARLAEHFKTWFYSENPEADDSLVFDPAPVRLDPQPGDVSRPMTGEWTGPR